MTPTTVIHPAGSRASGSLEPGSLRTVVHINVRLERGGAAKIARNLSTQLVGRGYRGRLVYGYGPRAGPSPDEDHTQALRLTSRARAGTNAVVHRAIGREVIRPGATPRRQLAGLAAASDLIHLHALHSFMGPARPLVAELRRSGRPIVWTLHDSWAMTGRCAIPGTCQRWAVGCGSCPDRSAYPGAALDLTKSGARARRSWIGELHDVRFVAPSENIAARFRTVYPALSVQCIHNAADPEFVRTSETVTPLAARAGYAVVAEDLSDPQKAPPRLLAALVAAGVPLVLVGRRSAYRGPLVRNLGPITDRGELAEVIGSCQALLFLSQIDVFSLTVLEALVGGVPVLALDSEGAREALSPLGIRTLSEDELLAATRAGRPWAAHPHAEPGLLASQAAGRYATAAMAGRYADLYDSLVGQGAA